MKQIFFSAAFFLYVAFFFSCTGQNNSVFIPVPDSSYFLKPDESFDINTIIETKDGTKNNGRLIEIKGR